VKVNVASGGAEGTDTSTTAGTGTTVTIQGKVVEVGETSFVISSGQVSSGTFKVSAPGGDGTAFDTSVDGSSFSLDGVRWTSSAWLIATPSTSSDLLPGLVAFDSTQAGTTPVVIPVARKSSLESLGLALTTPTTIDTTKAQIVLRFVNASGVAVSGVAVTASGVGHMAYDLGGGYTDDTKKTGNAGLAFLFNVDAIATPASRTLVLSGAVTGETSILVQAGAATVTEIAVLAK
jgi:hypothetical protein